MAPRRRRSRPRKTPLEDHHWPGLVLDHIWSRVPRRQITHEKFLKVEAVAKEFTDTVLRDAVAEAIADARARRGDDADLDDVMDAMHPGIKAFCAERGVEISDWEAVPY